MNRVRKAKFFLWLLTGLAAAVGITRFFFGLGTTTNLTDATPWGVWIGFDVMSGVALAAGGFIVTATVYIFKLERFHSVVRPAVLTAFLGYIAVAVGLLFDLGLPWNIWHMIIYWNPHSPLFEVGWCVMLYLTVLSLEFFPVPAEEFSALAKVRRFLIKLRLPLVIAGIALSTLHQSSLGSLFLIMPSFLHPLWYSPILPVMFFVSAIGLGLTMVMFESHTTGYLYYRKPETDLMASLAKAARWVLLGYFVLRMTDLAIRGELYHLMGTDWPILWFWFELSLMVFIPVILFSVRAIRENRAGQWTAAGLTVSGIVLNRINVGGFMHTGRAESVYVPSWMELTISAGVVSLAILVFLFFVEHFKVWEERPVDPDADPKALPHLHEVGSTWLGVPVVANRTVYSLGFIVAAAIGFAMISPEPANSRGVDPTPVSNARGGEKLFIDGNLDGFGTLFDHEAHVGREGEQCATCHHMSLPTDMATTCDQCHQDMYLPTDAFRHGWHSSPEGAALSCTECHSDGEVRTADSAKECTACHESLFPEAAAIRVKQYKAIGYVSAMHQLCIGCHTSRAQLVNKPELPQCGTCHPAAGGPPALGKELQKHRRERVSKGVVLPPY